MQSTQQQRRESRKVIAILKKALPASERNIIESVWNIQHMFYGYQIKGLSYPNRFKIVEDEAVLLN